MTDVDAARSIDRAEQRWLAEARDRLMGRPAGAHDDTDGADVAGEER